MSTLKVNKLRDTTGSTDAIVLDPSGGAVLAGVTTVTSVKVGAAVTITESGIEASGIGITCANINGTQIGGRRNIVINGAMNVAQRGTSTTTNTDFGVDRFMSLFSGTDEAPTFAQHALTSSDTGPYAEGFRNSLHITNGNQTSGAGTNDYIAVDYRIEAQDIANSGWNYTSSSSFITVSYWIKSSVAQNFYVTLKTEDGTSQNYGFETGSLSANTWTKITKKIPGNSNLQFDNNNAEGLRFRFVAFRGTDKTSSSYTLNTWSAYSSSSRMPDNTSTWYTTNDATFEITGFQLEVGPEATPFEHRSYGEELDLCMRYFQQFVSGNNYQIGMGAYYASNQLKCIVGFIKEMRSTPSVIQATGTNNYVFYRDSAADTFDSFGVEATDERKTCLNSTDVSGTVGHGGIVRTYNADGRIDFSAEL